MAAMSPDPSVSDAKFGSNGSGESCFLCVWYTSSWHVLLPFPDVVSVLACLRRLHGVRHHALCYLSHLQQCFPCPACHPQSLPRDGTSLVAVLRCQRSIIACQPFTRHALLPNIGIAHRHAPASSGLPPPASTYILTAVQSSDHVQALLYTLS
jgi:hypothetical protein